MDSENLMDVASELPKTLPESEELIVKISPNIDESRENERSTHKQADCDMKYVETTSNNDVDESSDLDFKDDSMNDCDTTTQNGKVLMPIPASCELLQINEDSRSSVQSGASRSTDPILKQGCLFSSISASNIIEYQWPADDTGEYYMIQEQISSYLGVTSFKRKYPDIDRHKLGPQELNHLMLKMLVSEVQVTLGLTAVKSRDVCDLMMREYPEKFDAYLAAQDEKRKETIRGKHQQYSTPAVEKSQLPNYMKKAMKQVSDYNAKLNRRRKDDFAVYYDMQTNVLQFPKWKYKKLHPDITRPSLYPCSLIPGQFQEYCQKYTAEELGYFPLNTAIYGPPPPPPVEISELMQDSEGSEDGSIADETMETEVVEAKADTPPEEGTVENEEKEAASNESLGSPSNEKSVVTDENSRDSIYTKDHSSSDKDTETTSNNAVISKEELLQNYIDDPDKPMCGLCLRDETCNKKGEPEDLISCSQCDNYGHPSCLDMSKELVSVIVTYNWQCLECKTCTYCNKPHHEDKMMFCDRCDRGYHTFCVGLRNLPSGLWMCPQCTRSDPDFAKKGGGRRRGPRKRKLSNDSPSNPEEPPKPKRKRRTKKEMEEAREKERLEKEEKLKKMERKAEKKERRRRKKLRKEQKAAAAAAAAAVVAAVSEGQEKPSKEEDENMQDKDETDSKVQGETPSPIDSNEPATPKIDDNLLPSKEGDGLSSNPTNESTENPVTKDEPDTAVEDTKPEELSTKET